MAPPTPETYDPDEGTEEPANVEDMYVPEEPEPNSLVVSRPVLVQSGVECLAEDQTVRPQKSWQLCAEQAAEAQGHFFAFGTGWKAGKCHVEFTYEESCPEGFKSSTYDFFKLAPITVRAWKRRAGATCAAMSLHLEGAATSDACAVKVAVAGQSSFLYGTGGCFCMPLKTAAPTSASLPAASGAGAECAGAELDTGTFDFYELEEVVPAT